MNVLVNCGQGGTYQINANDTSRRGAGGQFSQAPPMSASEVEDLIAPIDSERIHHPQILAPGFASHDEGNYPAQQSPRISGMFGDKAGAAYAHSPATGAATAWVDSSNVILSAAADTTAGRTFLSKALSFIAPWLRLHDRRIACLVTSIFGPQCASWPSGWLAENEGRLAVSENVAANQCVGGSALHTLARQDYLRIRPENTGLSLPLGFRRIVSACAALPNP
jgi:hypothetical protein